MPNSRLPGALVADANVVLSAVIGGQAARVFGLSDGPPIFGASAVRLEILEWLPKLAEKRGLDLGLRLALLQLLPITWVESRDYATLESEARERMRSRDVEDWPTLAVAMILGDSRDVAIWTNDKDFEASQVRRVTTAQLLAAIERRPRR